MERLTFLFDPRSPWCYQTSRWARRLEALGEITLGWGVFSLEVVNLRKEGEDPETYDAEYGPSLRVAVALRSSHGEAVIGDFYGALGRLMWETPVPAEVVENNTASPSNAELTAQALAEIGIDRAYLDTVLADPQTWLDVLEEHRGWADRAKAFGVPTLVLGEPGSESGVFGPVLRELPDDERAVELWRHLRGLVDNGHIYEVKKLKQLTTRADLPGAVWRANLRIADMRAARELMAEGGPYEGASLEWTMAAVRAETTGAG